MSVLDDLEFVKKVPVIVSERNTVSPLDRARAKLLADIDVQIALARDPNHEIIKTTKKRSGETEEVRRKPRSWVSVQDDAAYITVRFSNKPMPLGGKRGGVIKCDANAVAKTLEVVKTWAQSDEATGAIEKAMKAAKRKK